VPLSSFFNSDSPKILKTLHPDKFTVGTLVYDKRALYVLFFWLMWNDFSFMLGEQLNSLTRVLMRDRGASYTLITAFATVGGLMGMWINPVFSTWSDRFRSPFGRRRPFLIAVAPIAAITIISIPFAPDFYHFLMRFEGMAGILNRIPINGEVLFIGIASIIDGLFNAVLFAIFSYLYWDVVPQSVLGRFNAMAKIVTVSAGMVWSFWIVGYADHHPKEVYIAVSLVCTTIYVLSLIMVKEGEYPPPEPRKSSSAFAPFQEYVKDCYSKPYFLWIFLGTLFYQLGNQGGNFQFFYLREDLGMDLGETGWVQGIASGVVTAFGLLLGYSSGSLIDRFKPIRVVPLTLFVSSTLALVSFFVISEKVSAATMASLSGINNFVFGVALGAVTVQLFPREKLGQFCSAQAFFYQTIIMVLSPLAIAPFFDWLDFNRGGYLWSAFFYLLAGLVTVKVYFNWKKKHENDPPETDSVSAS
jgi:maltose/moltooligosaccharide transporter